MTDLTEELAAEFGEPKIFRRSYSPSVRVFRLFGVCDWRDSATRCGGLLTPGRLWGRVCVL
jgi:hypothetical protein